MKDLVAYCDYCKKPLPDNEIVERWRRVFHQECVGLFALAAVDRLVEFFNAAEPETPEEIDEILREVGYDPDELAERIIGVVSQAIRKQKQSGRV